MKDGTYGAVVVFVVMVILWIIERTSEKRK
jgi:hypothetical protein